MSRWKIRKICGVWDVENPDGRNYELFTTWARAMEYADRKSRLAPGITIKDPTGAFCALTAINKRSYINLKAGDDTFTLAPHEWRPLAGFLLEAAKNGEKR